MANEFVEHNKVPGVNEFNIADGLTFPEGELDSDYFDITDNHTPVFADPVNLMHFDIGQLQPEDANADSLSKFVNVAYPSWINLTVQTLTGTQSGMPNYVEGETPVFNPPQGQVTPIFHNNAPMKPAGGYYPEHQLVQRNRMHWHGRLENYEVKPVPGSNPVVLKWTKIPKTFLPRDIFYSQGGPRNNGYTTINNGISFRINDNIEAVYNEYSRQTQINNSAWKHGSIELTIRPTKENCTIISGASGARSNTGLREFPTGSLATPDAYLQYQLSGEFNDIKEGAQIVEFFSAGVGIQLPTQERVFSDVRPLSKFWKLGLKNGKLVFEYKVPYEPNKKNVVINTDLNIVDGKWHHIVLNRTNGSMKKYPGVKNGGEGALELWVDGQLVGKTYEINYRDNLPTPKVLFNDQSLAAWQLLEFGAFGSLPEVNAVLDAHNYVGDVSDYVFRQSYPLNPQEINLNKTYSFTSSDDKIVRVQTLKASAQMVMPNITSNKKKALKLYWNNLIDNKEKMLDGLELENDTFDVYTYSITHKNLLSSSQTLNLDKNYDDSSRFFYQNARVAVKDHVFILGPQTVPLDWFPLDNRAQQIDTDDNAALIRADNLYINNMLVGGVELKVGDRILLLGQNIKSENGIWIFNGPRVSLTRPEDVDISTLKNAHVYVEQGNYANTTWVQTNTITHLRRSKQTWIQINNNDYVNKPNSAPLHTTPWQNQFGDERFIDVNSDIAEDFDVIVFMNYPRTKNDIIENIQTKNVIETDIKYSEFINNLKTAVNGGKRLYVSSPMLAKDLGIIKDFDLVSQLIGNETDAQSASISPFEINETADKYYNTHRNMKYQVVNTLSGLTNKNTYIMSDFVAFKSGEESSDYHIKYNYRQFGLQQGDEFYIPGLTTIPETKTQQLPGFSANQKQDKDLVAFKTANVLLGTPITALANNIYVNGVITANPYHNYITTIAVTYGSGKMFVNCVEDAYSMSRTDYNKGIIQNAVNGQNSETALTSAWQYSTSRLNKKNLYDFSEITNIIGQTDPTNAGGGPIVQSQSHCSNGMIRKDTNKGDLKFQSDLYPDFAEESFSTTEIPVLSMTWLGLKWLAE
jgi:hypothetical protein